MAYFRCGVAPGHGGDGADLIVTCSQNFAGTTITCTDGNKTYTQQCPSSSPYEVTFESIPTGTWTISGVISGQTFSTTKTITNFTAQLADIPDGATVTPTDDIQIWLHCANIWDKNYTTIGQILADSTSLLALISSNNAVDYMVRSTSWASSVCANSTAMTYIGANDYCADLLLGDSTWCNAICNSTYFESVLNVKVPTMTSNNTPSGTASSSPSVNANTVAYKVFDGDDSTYWQSQDRYNNPYIVYQFTASVAIKVIELLFENVINYSSKDYVFQGSNDGANWTDVSATYSSVPVGTKQKFVISSNNNSYLYYRILFSGYTYDVAANAAIHVGTMQFYGRA